MAVVIRLKRMGRRNHPTYRIAVADSAKPTDGRTLEILGFYDPIHPNPERREKVEVERARHWLSVGALPSHTVKKLLERNGVYEGVEPPKKRQRSGPRGTSKKSQRRTEAKTMRTERKTKRRDERVAAKRAAAKAAASGGEGE